MPPTTILFDNLTSKVDKLINNYFIFIGNLQQSEKVVEKENIEWKSKTKGSKSRRNASLEIILENGRIQSHRNFPPKFDYTSRPGVCEAKDIKITKNIQNKIRKRTRAAFNQAIQGGKSTRRNHRVTSPLQNRDYDKPYNSLR